MSGKFHVNSEGRVMPCTAQSGNCPFGGDDQHFDNFEEAQLAADKKNELLTKSDDDHSSSKKDKEEKIFDSSDTFESYRELFEELDYTLSERTVKPRGEIVGWMLLSKRHSRYGKISHSGETGFKRSNERDLAGAILSVDADRFTVEDDQGFLRVTYYDHDGSSSCLIKPIAKSREYALQSKSNNFDKLIDYVEKMPSIRMRRS